MLKSAQLDKIPQALKKTGFLLEHLVSETFQKANWSVIGNRYYADDIDGKARELDLIAYRVTKVEELDVFTGVLISCKKDAEHIWSFMSKAKPARDPNIDWYPVHHWTDVEPLASFLHSCEWRENYIRADKDIYNHLFRGTRNVFATQLISSNGTVPKNDKPIYDSVTGLFKALDHELKALPNRAKGKRRIYIFTLLTVVDAPLVDVQYEGDKGTAIEVDVLTYLARYMVRRQELSAHVHFVRSGKIKEFVNNLSSLADHNSKHMASLIDESFDAIRTSNKVRSHLQKVLELHICWKLNQILRKHKIDQSVKNIVLTYSENVLVIDVDVGIQAVNLLNDDVEAQEITQENLKNIARYNGEFRFDLAIPF